MILVSPQSEVSERAEDEICVIDEILEPALYERLFRLVCSTPMMYGSRSNTRHDPHGHWRVNYISGGRENLADLSSLLDPVELEPVRSAWEIIQKGWLKSNLLVRCYVNGYTYGTDGYFHSDSRRPDEHTCVLYMTGHWDPDWGGETVFLDTSNDISKAVLPKQNRVVIFPAHFRHAARSVSRKCTDLRYTLIFKSRSKRSPNFERLSQFLFRLGATKLPHKRGSLHDHLVRTFSILESAGCDSLVCFVGGMHALYGTSRFAHSLISPERRSIVASEFGQDVEQLVHIFSTLDRPRTLENPVQFTKHGAIVKLRNGDSLDLSADIFEVLRMVECANMMDQDVLDRNTELRRFWASKTVR